MCKKICKANNVKATIVSSLPSETSELYKTNKYNYKISFLKFYDDKVDWKNEITFDLMGTQETYTIYGSGFVKKRGSKIFYDLNGSGVWTTFIREQPEELIEFSIFQNITAKKYENGSIKFFIKEQSTGLNNKIQLYPYTLVADFCCK